MYCYHSTIKMFFVDVLLKYVQVKFQKVNQGLSYMNHKHEGRAAMNRT